VFRIGEVWGIWVNAVVCTEWWKEWGDEGINAVFYGVYGWV